MGLFLFDPCTVKTPSAGKTVFFTFFKVAFLTKLQNE